MSVDCNQPHPATCANTRKVWSVRSWKAIYRARAPPSATPIKPIKAVRNGSCSMGAVAPEDLEVEEEDDEGEDDEEELVLLVVLAEPHSSC